MEPIIIETPQGYKVYIKPKITFGDERAIQQAINERLSFNAETQKPNPVTIADLQAGNEKAFELLILKIIMPDGSEAKDKQAVLYDLDPADGKLIKEKIDEIYEASKTTEEIKKNTTISELEPSSPSTPTQ